MRTRLHARIIAPIDALVGALTDPARRDRAVVGVLAAYAVAWTLYGVLAKASQDVHYDMAELAAWAREPALGYSKHPPLAAWVVRAWFTVFPVGDWAYYLLGMTFAALALWVAWLLLCRFLDGEKRVVALALLSFVPFFNFHALKFDHNAVLVPLWAATTLWFIRSFETRSIGWAALAGAGAAAAMLGKYWSIFLLAGLGLAAVVDPRRAAYFRSAAPWVTTAAGMLVLAPHIAWLASHDFAPFSYALAAHETNSLLAVATSVAGYLAGADGYVALAVLFVLAASRPNVAALSDMLAPPTAERRFAATAFWIPLLLPALVALAIGVQINSLWTAPAWTLLPIVLLSSPLVSISRSAVVSIVAVAVLLPPLMAAAAPGIALAIHRAGVRPIAAHGRLLAERVAHEWRQTTGRPLRLIGGDIDLAHVAAFYLADHPSALSPFDPQTEPEADARRISREGIAMLCYAHDERLNSRTCVHRSVTEMIAAIVDRGPAGRRVEVGISRDHLGFAGEPARYFIFTVPPRE